tara:strand:+ start:76 stop:438 length:363 start_codon:yes stop_codon:yes gene_type:complete
MAVSVTNQATPLGSKIVQDTDADATAKDNTTGATGTLYYIEVVNPNSGLVYFKMADTTNATGGTTAAEIVITCTGNATTRVVIPEGIAFSAGFSHWCVTGAAEANTGAPSSNVTARYVTT